MEWQPIKTYDGLKTKPKLAAFFFEGEKPNRGGSGKYSLPPTVELTRTFGHRVCTHWLHLPDPPK